MQNGVKRLKIATVFCCLLLSSIWKAQEPYAVNITHKDGLPSNTVFQVFQDAKGYIWIAHQDGLSRYDGVEFLNYTSPHQNSRAGSFITEDIKGRIWYENFDGQLFYVEKDSLYYFSGAQSLGYIPFCITDKHLFVLNFEGVQIFDIHSLKLLKSIKQALNEIEYALCVSEELFFISDRVFYKVTPELELISNAIFEGKSIKTKQIVSFQDQLIVYSKYNENQKRYHFDHDLNLISTKELTEPEYIQGGFVIQDELWLASSNGIVVVELTAENATPKRLFERTSISNVLLDIQGNYWVSSLNKGIYLISNIDNSFYTFKDFSPTKMFPYKKGWLMSTQEGMLVSCTSNLKDFNTLLQDNEKVTINYSFYDSFVLNAKTWTHFSN
jgi:ligand-binding sensor domain-containing protein